MSEKDLGKRIKQLEKQMLEHARNLEFEKAARVRDQLALLREQAFGAPGTTATSCRRACRGAAQVTMAETLRVLMVCMGNICRSPTAEGVLRAQAARPPGWTTASRSTRPARSGWHAGEAPDRARAAPRRAARLRPVDAARAPVVDGRLRALRPDAGDGRRQPRRPAARREPAQARLLTELRRFAARRSARPVLRRRGRLRARARPGRGRLRRPGRRCCAAGAMGNFLSRIRPKQSASGILE